MEDRKKRLAALASRAGRSKPSDENNDNDTADNDAATADEGVLAAKERSNVTFRNYTPNDATLEQKGEKDQDDKSGANNNKRSRDEKEDDKAEPPPKKSALEEALEQAQQDLTADSTRTKEGDNNNNNKSNSNNKTAEQGGGGGELTSLAPKKINWDLKRDIQPKLDKLERRTQKVIVQLLKERLAREAENASEEEEQDLD